MPSRIAIFKGKPRALSDGQARKVENNRLDKKRASCTPLSGWHRFKACQQFPKRDSLWRLIAYVDRLERPKQAPDPPNELVRAVMGKSHPPDQSLERQVASWGGELGGSKQWKNGKLHAAAAHSFIMSSSLIRPSAIY